MSRAPCKVNPALLLVQYNFLLPHCFFLILQRSSIIFNQYSKLQSHTTISLNKFNHASIIERIHMSTFQALFTDLVPGCYWFIPKKWQITKKTYQSTSLLHMLAMFLYGGYINSLTCAADLLQFGSFWV